jgi:hypothetical protein
VSFRQACERSFGNLIWGYFAKMRENQGRAGPSDRGRVLVHGAGPPTQAIAMIGKRYQDHPELWAHPLGEQILDALTVERGPCQGKSPLVATP